MYYLISPDPLFYTLGLHCIFKTEIIFTNIFPLGETLRIIMNISLEHFLSRMLLMLLINE